MSNPPGGYGPEQPQDPQFGQGGFGQQHGGPAGYTQPGQGPSGYGPQYQQQPSFGSTYAPNGMGGQTGYPGPPYGTPSSTNPAIIIGIIAGVVALIAIAATVFFVTRDRPAYGDYGSDRTLDALRDQCAAGDNAACDQLYRDSPVGSEYEDFGDTCGGRGRPAGQIWCDTQTTAPTAGYGEYGSDPALDELWDECAGGSNAACDALYRQAPSGSSYEEFGDNCGPRGRPAGQIWCDVQATVPTAGYGEYGSDPVLDALWDQCAAGSNAACDALYRQAPSGSSYQEFGDNCGPRGRPSGQTWCDVQATVPTAGYGEYGSDPVLDALWDQCAAGDNAACDQLYRDSPLGSQYEDFGDTCGGRGLPPGRIWCAS